MGNNNMDEKVSVQRGAAEKKLDSFRELEAGWYHGEGIAPSAALIEKAKTLVQELSDLGVPYFNVFPEPEGSIEVTAHHRGSSWVFLFKPDKTIEFYWDEVEE